MTTPRFVQIHFLTAYPGVLLNRDDAGLAKRLPFDGGVRTRVSFRSLKRHWRMADDPRGLPAMAKAEEIQSLRTKRAIEDRVTGPLRDALPEEVIGAIEMRFVTAVYGAKAKEIRNRQALLLGQPEIAYLAEAAMRIAQEAAGDAKAADAVFKQGDGKANLKQLREQNALAPGLESALFGRMVTSDPRANTDAAIHVAHAFTVHAEQPELDDFTAVDDLAHDDETGAAGLFDIEITSGLFYGYVVVDVPLLVSNLAGRPQADWAGTQDRDLAARVLENLIHLIATVSPGAKKGSTAPYSWAELILVEVGERQPRTLANAFRDPRGAGTGRTLGGAAAKALAAELASLDAMFGAGETRLQAARGALALPDVAQATLPQLAERIAAMIRTASIDGPAN